MKVASSFYSVAEEDMANKKIVVIHHATKLHPMDQKKNSL